MKYIHLPNHYCNKKNKVAKCPLHIIPCQKIYFNELFLAITPNFVSLLLKSCHIPVIAWADSHMLLE
jgi:hypothetical protein